MRVRVPPPALYPATTYAISGGSPKGPPLIELCRKCAGMCQKERDALPLGSLLNRDDGAAFLRPRMMASQLLQPLHLGSMIDDGIPAVDGLCLVSGEGHGH